LGADPCRVLQASAIVSKSWWSSVLCRAPCMVFVAVVYKKCSNLLIYVIIRAVLVRRAQRANGRVALSDCGLEVDVLLWLFFAGFGCVCWLCCGGLCLPISGAKPGAPAPARSAEIPVCCAFIKLCAGSQSAKRSVTTLLRWCVQCGFCTHCAAFANPFATLFFQDKHIPFVSRLVCFI
jgi:hypothetical protein